MKKCLALILVLLMTFTLVSVLASCEGTEVETNPETEGSVTDPAEDPTDDVETEPNADDVTDSVENTEGSDSDSATDSDEKATESDGEQTTDSDGEKTTDSDGETDGETDKSDAIAFEGMTVVAINQMQDIASGLAKDLSAVTGCNIKYGTYANGAQIKLVTTSTSGTGIGAAYTVKYSSSTITLSALNKVTLAYAISDFVARIKSGLEITEGFEESYALEVKTVAATDTKLFKYCGTWQATDKNNPETMVSYWDAAYVEVDFTGSAITLTFSSATTFKYSIDGGSYVTASNVTGDYTVYAGNGGTHTVRVLTDTQANNIHFAGVKAEKNVTLSRTADKKYYIQFVGDSISDDIKSFSHNSPEILGWDYSVTACWAISMVKDWGSWKVMNGYDRNTASYAEGSMAWYLNKNFGTLSIGMEDAFFKLGIPHQLANTDPRFADYAENYFTEKYDHDFNTGNTPDIVFIFLGTNDLGFTSGQGSIDKFKDRYKNFVANIFELYGDDTQIVVMQAVSTSKEGSDLYNTDCGRYEGIRQTADELMKLYPENVRFLDEDTLLSWNVEISSDNTHPSVNGYNTLSTKIAEWLDEEFVTLKPNRPTNPDDNEPDTEKPTEEKCEHEYKRETINNDLVITCTKGCGYKYEYKVDSTAALNFWNAENLGAWSNISGKIDYTTHFELNGPQYSRFTNVRASSNQMGLNAGKSGERYLIIKIRVGENGLGQTYVQLYAPSNLSSSQNYGNAGLQIKVSEDGQWHTIVVDLAERVASGGYNLKDGGYDLSTVYIRPFGNKQSAAVGNTDVYVDMAYLAICDSLSDVAKLVGGDTYEWSVSSTANEIRNTADLPTGGDDPEPPTQTETKTETETEAETEKEPEKLNIPAVEPSKGCAKCNVKVTQNGNKYTWKCAACNTVYDEMTLSDAVNYYTAVGQFNTSAWAATVSNRIYADGDVLYQRFSITNHGATIPLVTSGNVKNGYLVDSKGGNGRYFVFKMRTVNVEALAWRITATTASGTATDPSGSYLARREAMPEGEWVVYVVDIAALLAAESRITTYGTAGNPDLTRIAAGFMYGHNLGGTVTDAYLDIAYFAVCDNWEEIESVVGDDKVILTDWKNNTSDKKLSSSGELPVDTKGDDAAKVIFSKTGNKMQIYLRSPDAEKYTKYDFIYIENASRKFASWKLESIEICDSDLNKLYNTMVGDSTECEGALQERYADGSLASDFIGGYHGDEKLKKITVFIDGIELDMSKDYDLTACESVKTIVESELFSCDTTNKVFDRVRTNTWTKDGLEIKNKYTATAKITINRPETSMLAISLDYGEYKGLITEHWDNVHNEWIEIGEFNVSEGRYSASGMTEAKMRGLLNVSVSAYDCTFNGQALTPTGHFSYNYFSEDNMRVKIYIAPFSNRTFAVGDVFESTSFQSVFAAE